jgi:alpha/beta superfamily hydrolase
MRNNVVDALCRAALLSGSAALRFNFRGVGGSEGRYGQGVAEQGDVRAALSHLRSLPEIDGERTALAGYSFGAAVSLRAADASLRGLVLVSLPTMMGRLEPPAGGFPVLLVSGDNDEYSDQDDLTAFAESMGDRVEIVFHRGVDHFWWGSDDRLVDTVSRFLRGL